MGIRFHRSIKIAKGLRLNISKKGLGVSAGPRGAKISAGPSGVYSNIGIPGSGLYARNKISGISKHTNSSNQNSGSSSATNSKSYDVQISIDDKTGKEEIKVFDNGVEVYDKSLLRKIRLDSTFKERLQKLREQTDVIVKGKTNILVDIHKHSQSIPNWEELKKESKSKKPEKYIKAVFNIPKPSKNDVYKKLEVEAKNNVKAFFWRKRKIEEYINQKIDKSLGDEINKWQLEKDNFELKEKEAELAFNNKQLSEFDEWMNEFNLLFNPSVEYLSNKLEKHLSEIEIPVDFSVSFDILEDGKTIYLDIDLPEIEDYPQKKSNILASGKLSIRNKAIKEKKFEYKRSVSGLSIYFASIAFSLSPIVEEVVVSGYTQRVNKATGNTEDEYVYSVKYDSKGFNNLNIEKVEPELTLQSFQHRIKTTQQHDLRKIEPFTP